MTLLEATLYILVVTAADKPFLCERSAPTVIVCTHGHNATYGSGETITIDNKIKVEKKKDGEVAFSNGVTGRFDSFGWVRFSNGISVRRTSEKEFASSTKLSCTPQGDKVVRCVRGG